MSPELSLALGSSLLHSLWQGAVVALIFAIVYRFVQRAHVRYILACCALVTCLLLAVNSFVNHYELDQSSQSVTPQSQIQTEINMPIIEPIEELESASIEPTSAPASIPTVRPKPFNIAVFLPSLTPYLALFWLIGVALLSLRLLAQLVQIERFKKKTKPARESLEARVTALANRLELHQKVRVLESHLSDSAAVVGVLKPLLFIPVSAITGLSPQQLDAVLLHELAHIRRHDYLVNLLQTFTETLLFYHPAVWWLSAVIRKERENACDDVVVQVTGNKLEYARALVALEEKRQPALALAAKDGDLTMRIKRLYGLQAQRRGSSWLAGLVILAGLGIGLAALNLNQAGLAQVSENILPDYKIWITKSPTFYLNSDANFENLIDGDFAIIEERRENKIERWLLVKRDGSDVNYSYLEGDVTLELDLRDGITSLPPIDAEANQILSGDFSELPKGIKSWLQESLARPANYNEDFISSQYLYTAVSPLYMGEFGQGVPTGSLSIMTDLGIPRVEAGSHSHLFILDDEFIQELSDNPFWTEQKYRYILLEGIAASFSQAEHLRSYNLVSDADVLASFESVLEYVPELKPELAGSSAIIRDAELRASFLAQLDAAPNVARPRKPTLGERRELIEEGEAREEALSTMSATVTDASPREAPPTYDANVNRLLERLSSPAYNQTLDLTPDQLDAPSLWATVGPGVKFDKPLSKIEAITSPNGFFVLEERDEVGKRIAFVRQNPEGTDSSPSFTYLVNGAEQPFDDEAKAWYEKGLEQVALKPLREHGAKNWYEKGLEQVGLKSWRAEDKEPSSLIGYRTLGNVQESYINGLYDQLNSLNGSQDDLAFLQHVAAHQLNTHNEIAEHIKNTFKTTEPDEAFRLAALYPISELSDTYKADVLSNLSAFYKGTPALQNAFDEVARTIKDETLRNEALRLKSSN